MDSASHRITDPVDGTAWEVDLDFLASNWTCIWGRGCEGIMAHRAGELQQGCCSVGAEVLDEEAGLIEALGLSLDPARFAHAAVAAVGGVFTDASRSHTRVVDGACIFFNPVGFDGGVGCALHLAAEDEGERPMDWKPAVCWQVPFRVEDVDDSAAPTEAGSSSTPVRRLRRWRSDDWGDEPVAWCCTDPGASPSANVSATFLADSMADELSAIVGPEVAVEIRRRARDHASGASSATDPACDP